MISSILISIAFVIGIFVGIGGGLPGGIVPQALAKYVLYALIFFVGISVGANVKIWKTVKKMHFKIALVPMSVVIGTLSGVGVFSLFLSTITLPQALAIGSGFGYYSLSSVIIAQLDGEALGTIALISNLMREIVTIIAAPFFAHYFGRLAPIAAGGATSMDTTLPVITKYSGSEYTVISIFSGMVLTFLVPMLVPIFL
jgi:uncharacterized membrane protein YbjE (DUF340 family)